MLRGSALAKVDDKGRLKLPTAFRTLIESTYGREFFVTSIRGESVLVYPLEIWLRVERRLLTNSSLDPAIIRFKNAVNFFGQGATMDAQGRILIHPLLRERAAIDGHVTIIGHQEYLEVWNRATFVDRMTTEPVTDDDLRHLAVLGVG